MSPRRPAGAPQHLLSSMLTFASKTLSTGANGQKEDAASFFHPRNFDRAARLLCWHGPVTRPLGTCLNLSDHSEGGTQAGTHCHSLAAGRAAGSGMKVLLSYLQRHSGWRPPA